MRFLANIYEPTDPTKVLPERGFTRLETWQRWQVYLRDKVIGDPMPADGLDARTLRQLGIVGVYQPEPGDVPVEELGREFVA